MAQVQETVTEGLKRELVIKVPQDIVNANWTKRLEEIGKKAKLPGFRPGKIPMPILKQNYGAGARSEALDETVSEVMSQTLSERKLRPALQPRIELVSFGEDKDLEFKVTWEILPDVKPADFSKIALERPVAEVEEKSIEEAVARIAKAFRKPEAITDNRAAIMGDVLVINFDGTVDGEARPGMKGSDHKLELGTKSFIDTFEEQLVGSKIGDKKTIKVTFPADYHAADLSGKAAEFAVEIKEILAHKPLEMNDALAKEVGLPSMEKLRERIKDDLANGYTRASRNIAKRALMDKLAETHSFDVPAGLIEAEFTNIWGQVQDAKTQNKLPPEDKNKSDDELKKDYRSIAERRVRLGLLLAEVAQQQKIGVSQEELRKALMDEMRRFPGQEKAVMDYYTKTQGALDRMRAPILEEKVTDYILSQAKVTDKKISADELLKKAEEEDEEG